MPYPIGTPGQPWTDDERATWLATRERTRSHADIVARIEALADRFEVVRYGTLEADGRTYPLLALVRRSPGCPVGLVTGGVHGYETSGVLGALRFAETVGDTYDGRLTVVVVPCVSPWGWETEQRWTADAIDPNRNFTPFNTATESRELVRFVHGLGPVQVHIDLHETTDSDDDEFRPARAARDGTSYTAWGIPDGFYLVGRTDRPQLAFQAAINEAVSAVTHIADADANGLIIGEPICGPGIIVYDAVALGLCMGITDAPFTTTTEVYPDSPRTDPETCIQAQVVAARTAFDVALG